MSKAKRGNGMKIRELNPYRIVIMSDLHCGAATGLTNMEMDYSKSELLPYQDRREELWKMFTITMKEIGQFEELWVLGDIINGPVNGISKRDNLNNVTEQQTLMALDIFEWIREECNADHGVVIVEGTEWHVGDGGAENDIANYFGTRSTKGTVITVGGVNIDIKHKIGGSNRPHLHGNMIVAEYEAAVSNANHHGTKIPDLLIRAHRHLYDYKEGVCLRNGAMRKWAGMILPSLQAWGSDYGKRVCASLFPDVGFVHVDITGEDFTVVPHIFHLKSQVE